MITVSAAVDLAAEHGDPLSRESIQRAARLGQIANAQRMSFGYLFTDHDFLRWLRNRPKPGPKPREDDPMEIEYECDQCGKEFTAADMSEEDHGARLIVCTDCANELLQTEEDFHGLYVSPS
jgi:DNA-directed RNA polymerase subunit RPC12/RpoP